MWNANLLALLTLCIILQAACTDLQECQEEEENQYPEEHHNTAPCDDCRFVNGIGYNRHQSKCYLYYQCLNNNGVLVPIERECPFGQFWDQGDLTCKPAESVNCATDPCKRSSRPYKVSNNCRAYWKCSGGRTVSAECCRNRYRLCGSRCVFDWRCTKACPPNPSNPPVKCNKYPYGADRTKYYEDIGEGRIIIRPCAPGTAFTVQHCGCGLIIDVDPTPPKCVPDLYFPFDRDLKDKSDSNTPVHIDKVTVDRSWGNGAVGGGAAKFNGDAKMIVWRYANMELGSKFVIKFRYKALPCPDSRRCQGIITNSDCKLPCSVDITQVPYFRYATAKIRTEKNGTLSRWVYQSSGWNNVEYKYDGTNFFFSVNGHSRRVNAGGNIVRVLSALQIGTGCSSCNSFSGLLDELYVFRCIP